MTAVPTPDEWVRMPWYARAQYRMRHSIEPSPPPGPPTPQMLADLRETIRLLNDLLNERHRRAR